MCYIEGRGSGAWTLDYGDRRRHSMMLGRPPRPPLAFLTLLLLTEESSALPHARATMGTTYGPSADIYDACLNLYQCAFAFPICRGGVCVGVVWHTQYQLQRFQVGREAHGRDIHPPEGPVPRGAEQTRGVSRDGGAPLGTRCCV